MMTVLPSHPPCFEPDVWRGYVLDAAEQTVGKGSALTWHKGAALYNRGFDFCADCTPRHAVTMHKQGRCYPDHHRKPPGLCAEPPT